MKRIVIFSLCLVGATPLMLSAQVSDNINVLPVYRSNPPIPEDFWYGDLLAEGQNEATVVVNPLNPDNRMVFFNDYRFVYLDQTPVGTIGSLGDWLFKGLKGLLALFTGRPEQAQQPGRSAAAPGNEPWIGCAVTYDGGLTYNGCTVPGFPDDPSAAGTTHPARALGHKFATDPKVLGVDPSGTFLLAYITGVREGQSALMVSKFRFLVGEEVRHAVEYLGTRMLDRGQNMAHGLFLDLPAGSLLPNLQNSSLNVWRVSAARFSGQDRLGKIQTRMVLYESRDNGNTWTTGVYIDKTYKESQGVSHVTLPNGNTLIFVRNYNSPHTYYFVVLSPDGKLTAPKDLLANDPRQTLATFDQSFVTTRDLPFAGRIERELSPRTFGSPSFTGTPSGNLIVGVWQERVDPVTFLPSDLPGAVPRIVWKYSTDGGTSYSLRRALVQEGQNRPEPPGYGFFNPGFKTGNQYQGQVACGAGDRCLVTYYETEPYSFENVSLIGGYDRIVNLRGVFIQLNSPGTPPVVGQPFQISRYDYFLRVDGPATDAPNQIKQLCPPGSDPTTGAGCYAAKNYTGLPIRDTATTPFNGDYTANAAVEQYVRDASGTPRLAVTGADVPGGARFYVAFTDNSNSLWPGVAPAPEAPEGDWTGYFAQKWQGLYVPGGLSAGSGCQNDQLKDQNIKAATVSFGGLVLQSPDRFKPFPPPPPATSIEFPTTVYNLATARKSYALEITGTASLSKDDSAQSLTRKTGVVTVDPHSTSSFNVYAFDGAPVTLKATECVFSGATCAKVPNTQVVGTITFNVAPLPPGSPAPAYQPVSIALQPGTKSPGTKSPGTKSPGTKSPGTKSPGTKSPGTKSPVPAGETVYQVVDYSWEITPTSDDDVGTYAFLAGVDQAYKDNYIFELSIEKPSTLYTSVNCQPMNVELGTVVGRVVDATNPLPGLSPADLLQQEPLPPTPSLKDVIRQNSTFTIGATVLTTPLEGCAATTGAGRLGECTIAQPRSAAGNRYIAWLRAYLIRDPATLTPDQIFDPFGDNPSGAGVANPPSGIAAEISCADPSCLVVDGPNLAVPTPPTADVTPTTVHAGQTVTFPVGGVVVTNSGTQPAGKHGIGIYLSKESEPANLPRNSDGTIKEDATTRLVASLDGQGPLAAGGVESNPAYTFVVPVDIPRPDGTGTYYAYFYEDFRRKVNETNENDNIVKGGPITVLAPTYSFLGLFSPCTALACAKNTGVAIPLAFQLSYDGVTPVNSKGVGTDPRFTFYAPAAGGACQTNIGQGTGYLFRAAPGDVSPGGSGWQYFDASCAPVGPNTCPRPAYTWQYNFQGKDPATGADLPLGCYAVAVEDVGTNQIVGSQFGPVTWLQITLK